MPESVGMGGEGLTLSREDAVALSPVKVGMLVFIASEAAFFGTLTMTYVFFLRQTTHGEPNPGQVFRLPMVLAASACLFSSSGTIHLAEKAMRRGAMAVVPALVGPDHRPGRIVLAGHDAGVERADQ